MLDQLLNYVFTNRTRCTHTHFPLASPVLTGPAEPFSDRLSAAFEGHGACERSRQQCLPEEGGSERERSGGHRSEDAQQSFTDQHHAQVPDAANDGLWNRL